MKMNEPMVEFVEISPVDIITAGVGSNPMGNENCNDPTGNLSPYGCQGGCSDTPDSCSGQEFIQ